MLIMQWMFPKLFLICAALCDAQRSISAPELSFAEGMTMGCQCDSDTAQSLASASMPSYHSLLNAGSLTMVCTVHALYPTVHVLQGTHTHVDCHHLCFMSSSYVYWGCLWIKGTSSHVHLFNRMKIITAYYLHLYFNCTCNGLSQGLEDY